MELSHKGRAIMANVLVTTLVAYMTFYVGLASTRETTLFCWLFGLNFESFCYT